MSVPPTTTIVPALRALAGREIVRVLRQPARVVAGVGTVALIWLVFASGLAGAFASGETGYGSFLVPAMASMVAMFASVFGAISLIEDRQHGFLQGVLVSPAPTWAVMLSKLLGGVVMALAQGVLILALSPLTGVSPPAAGWLLGVLALAMMSAGVTGLGLALAWRTQSVGGFHGVMNLVLLPMWLLGGTLFPLDSAARWLSLLMHVNPLTWTTDALRQAMLGEGSLGPWAWVGSVAFCLFGLLAPSCMARFGRVRPDA